MIAAIAARIAAVVDEHRTVIDLDAESRRRQAGRETRWAAVPYGCGKTASMRGPSIDQNTVYGGCPGTGSRILMLSVVVIAVDRA